MDAAAYAIVLLIARLGLRGVDVRRLRFSDLDWAGNRVSVVQAKTGRRVSLPLLKDVGWAIIDYVRHGRPDSDCEQVFLRHTAPIGPFSEGDHLHQILVKHARAAHVALGEERRRGMHSLRHTLATRLMEDGTPDHDPRLEVFKTACADPPEGETHWTVRSLAETVGIGKSQTHAFLCEADLKPHQVRSWLTSLDPRFDTKQADVCGLYLAPPENAIVVSVDEKTSIQARQPIRKERPMRPGKPARREFEYKRHGVQALLAALLVHTGEVIASVYDRNTRIEFLDFLDQLEQQIPAGKEVHAILDNLQVHKTPEVTQWRTDHPRWTFHFTPTHASWLNQIELFFSILTRRLVRRGVFTSQADLRDQLLNFIDRYNPTAKPFAWTYQGKPLQA